MAFGRSSTSGHLSKDYETVTAGTAEHVFLGIPLQNDLSAATAVQLAGLAAVLLILLFHNRMIVNPNLSVSLVFWSVMLAVTLVFLAEVTWIPLLTTIIYTRTAYPYLVVIPHCIVAAASYRSLRGDSSRGVTSLGLGFLCWGFGGSIVSDVLMGLPATALGHARIIPCYILSWVLVWYSPFDVVYRLLSDRTSFVHYFLVACEAVDSVTTPMGRISRSARELNNKMTAPLAAGLLAGTGGSLIRYQVLDGEKAPLYAAMESGVWKTMGYSLLWWYLVVYQCVFHKVDDGTMNHCDSYNGSEELRVVIVCFHVAWTLACDLGYASGHPFLYLAQSLGNTLSMSSKALQLGPVVMQHSEVAGGGKKTEKED